METTIVAQGLASPHWYNVVETGAFNSCAVISYKTERITSKSYKDFVHSYANVLKIFYVLPRYFPFINIGI